MSRYDSIDNLFEKQVKSQEMDESNPNRGFRRKKWLEKLTYGEKEQDQDITMEYVGKQGNAVYISDSNKNPYGEAGVGIDITNVDGSIREHVDVRGNGIDLSSIGSSYITTKVKDKPIQTGINQHATTENLSKIDRVLNATGLSLTKARALLHKYGGDVEKVIAYHNSTTKVAPHDEQTPAPQLYSTNKEHNGSTIKVDQDGTEYKEEFDPGTGTRYFTFRSKREPTDQELRDKLKKGKGTFRGDF